MSLFAKLKEIEPNVSQIAKDAGVTRQCVYLWVGNSIPRESVFNRLASMEKYKSVFDGVNYSDERAKVPLGKRPIRKV